MEKNIIIDGVNVAGCKYLYNADFEFDTHVHCLDKICRNTRCRNNPNCYYKQLQRKEQECEQWKQKYYSSTTEVKEDLIKQNRTLKQECEKIKELIDACNVKDINALEDAFLKFEENFIMADSECEKLKAKNKELKEENTYLQGRVKGEIHLGNKYKQDFAEQVVEAQRYKQALEKIEEYCIIQQAYDGDLPFKTQMDDILEIINEVKDER